LFRQDATNLRRAVVKSRASEKANVKAGWKFVTLSSPIRSVADAVEILFHQEGISCPRSWWPQIQI
jgi:hypothetical protein